MSFLILGFITGLSLIFAIGAQNIFVIEQGLKKQYVFLVCLICSISDLILIFLGIFLFEYFKIYLTKNVELIFNILLFIFLIYFIYSKVRSLYKSSEINFEISNLSLKNIIIKTIEEEIKTSSGLLLSSEDANLLRYKKGVIIKSGTEVSVLDEGDFIFYEKRSGYSMILND